MDLPRAYSRRADLIVLTALGLANIILGVVVIATVASSQPF